MLTFVDGRSADKLDVMLPDVTGKISPANQLVWPDRPDFRERCQGAHFVAPDAVSPSGDLALWCLLCDLTGMSKLSDLVDEQIASCSPAEPTKHEICLVDLLKSAEFAGGFAALVCNAHPERVHDKDLNYHVHRALAALRVHWVSKLSTCLQSVNKEGNDDKVQECGSKRQLVFYKSTPEPTLWLESGMLSSDKDADKLISKLGGTVRVPL